MSEYQSVLGHEAVNVTLAQQWLSSALWMQTPYELCWPELVAKAAYEYGDAGLGAAAEIRLVSAGLISSESYKARFMAQYNLLLELEVQA